MLCCLIVSVISATIYLGQINQVIETKQIRTMQDLDFPFVGNDPGAGNYGWLNLSVVILNHFDYSTNLTDNESCFCWTDVNNTHAGTQEMDGVPIEIACQFRLNESFKAENGSWMWNSWFEAYCNSPSLSISDYKCDLFNVTADDTYLYGYAVADNSGSGYTLTDAQNVTSCMFNFSGYLP